jgi:xanthine dehydrogenase accessory factor
VQSLDIKVLDHLCSWLRQGKTVWLCTIVRTWGSAPRRKGSLLASCAGGVVGSLSGGCVEDDLIERLHSGAFDDTIPHYIVYGESETDAARFNLPCGGTLGVLVEPVVAEHLEHFQAILESLQTRSCITRHCSWPDGNYALDSGSSRVDLSLQLDDHAPVSLVHTYGPQTHLFIIGCNEVSTHLAEFALAVGYRVTVCDPRQTHDENWTVPGVLLVREMPDDAILQLANDADSAIVAVTHDPRMDDMGLMVAFETKAFYIGAMGSCASSQKRRERLKQLNVSETEMHRLHAPIGVDIGSKIPAEIAISILAEIIAARSGKDTAKWHV